MPRGRPPYPDLLTPKEQEVLELLREGLTNQQIADRLDISLPGARYHVSEILSKLGVSSRRQAAMWVPEADARKYSFAGLVVGRTLGFIALAAAAALIALLAIGVVVERGRNTSVQQEPPLSSVSSPASPEETVQPASTSTATATATPNPFLSAEFRNFALEVNEALSNQNIDFFREHVRATPIVCAPDGRIEGADAGERCEPVGQYDALGVRERLSPAPDETTWRPVDQAMENISGLWTNSAPQASDQYGSSEPVVYFIGVGNSIGANRGWLVVLTAIIEDAPGASNASRVSLILTAHPREDGSFDFSFIRVVFFGAEEYLETDTLSPSLDWERFSQ